MRRITLHLLPLAALAACTPATPAPSPTPAREARADAPADTARGQAYLLSEVDQQPELLNRQEIGVVIRAYYPGLLRDAGVEGTVTVRFIVGTDGVPERRSIQVVNATHPDFREGGERVAGKMRFAPARLAGRPVRVYVTLPISFSLH